MALLVALAACWTGPDTTQTPATALAPQPAPPRTPSFELLMQKTPCFGMCPVYTVAIKSSGEYEWIGEAVLLGRRSGQLTAKQIMQLDAMIRQSRFFERDESGRLVENQQPVCTTVGNATSCTFSSFTLCSDTSHTVITIKRGRKLHRVDNAHCTDDEQLTAFERMIDSFTAAE